MEKQHKLAIAVTAAAAAFWAVSFAAPVLANLALEGWRYYKPIDTSSLPPEDGLVEVVADRDVFVNASSALGDLRIVMDGSNQEVPYKLLVESGEQRRRVVSGEMRDLQYVPGQHTSFVAAVPAGALHNEVRIDTTSRNFERRVIVEGSNDDESWAVLSDRGRIFDFTVPERDFVARETAVRYPESTVRLIRVTVLGEERLQVTGAGVLSVQEVEAQLTPWIVARLERTEQAATRSSVLLLDLGDEGLPASRMVLASEARNFYRQARLEGSANGDTWRVLTEAVLFDYDTPLFTGRNLTLAFPEQRYRHYRLTIFNEDNPPLPIDGAEAQGAARKLIFPVAAGSTYLLYYGNPQAAAPIYDFERIFPYLITEGLPAASLGQHEPNPLYVVPAEPAVPLTERFPWLLPAALAIGSLFIGLMMARLIAELRGKLAPPQGS